MCVFSEMFDVKLYWNVTDSNEREFLMFSDLFIFNHGKHQFESVLNITFWVLFVDKSCWGNIREYNSKYAVVYMTIPEEGI